MPLLALPGVALILGATFTSNIGNWIQIFTEQWTVLKLAGPEAARWAGRMGFALGFGLLCFGSVGGALGDRYPKTKLVAMAQAWMGAMALGLAWLAFRGTLTLPVLVGFAALSGLGVAVSSPLYWSLVADSVPTERVAGTLALMSAQWNLSRVIGPVIAAWMLPLLGAAGNFLLNALSFLVLVFVVLRIKPARSHDTGKPGTFGEAMAHLRKDRALRHVVLLAALAGGLGWCYATFLPLYGTRYLGWGERGVAWLFSVFGVGALGGALHMAREKHPSLALRMRQGLALFGVGMLVLALRPGPWITQGALLAMGFAQATFVTSMGSQVQLLSPANLRGRINGLYVTGLIGLTPVGDLLVGEVAQRLGWVGPRVVEGAVGLLIFAALWAVGRPEPAPGSISES